MVMALALGFGLWALGLGFGLWALGLGFGFGFGLCLLLGPKNEKTAPLSGTKLTPNASKKNTSIDNIGACACACFLLLVLAWFSAFAPSLLHPSS
jgi:hypothetical protein